MVLVVENMSWVTFCVQFTQLGHLQIGLSSSAQEMSESPTTTCKESDSRRMVVAYDQDSTKQFDRDPQVVRAGTLNTRFQGFVITFKGRLL